MTIKHTRIASVRDGIYLSFTGRVMIDGNVIEDGRYGLHAMYARDLSIASNDVSSNVAGIVLMYGGPMLIIDNHLAENTSTSTGFGLLVKDVAGLEAAKNVVNDNRIGVHVEGPAGGRPEEQRFVLNTIALNGVGASVVPSAAAVFTGNSFVENQVQVVPVGGGPTSRVRWTAEGAGNYWSDYVGSDGDGDGVGETPHRAVGASVRMLDEEPSLYGLLGTPAFDLTTAAHRRWTGATGVVDDLPLTEPHSPMAPGPAGDPRGPTVWLSVVMIAAAALMLASVARSGRATARGFAVTGGATDGIV